MHVVIKENGRFFVKYLAKGRDKNVTKTGAT